VFLQSMQVKRRLSVGVRAKTRVAAKRPLREAMTTALSVTTSYFNSVYAGVKGSCINRRIGAHKNVRFPSARVVENDRGAGGSGATIHKPGECTLSLR
jgi:hypothetical protein